MLWLYIYASPSLPISVDIGYETGKKIESEKGKEIVKCKCEFVQDRKESHVRRYDSGPRVLVPVFIQ